jgi:hypothetical protein
MWVLFDCIRIIVSSTEETKPDKSFQNSIQKRIYSICNNSRVIREFLGATNYSIGSKELLINILVC